MTTTAYQAEAEAWAGRAQTASHALRAATTQQKNTFLGELADRLDAHHANILAANAKDLAHAHDVGLSASLTDRLRLDDARIDGIAKAVREIAALEDPVGRIDALKHRPSGIQCGKMWVPLGVVLMVYESRPNVTVDTAALCIKSGNAVILRGGKEAKHTNAALAAHVQGALASAGLPVDAALLVDKTDRELLYALLGQSGRIDLAIPRGGTGLIDAVNAHAKVPVLQHYQGICHVYVHAAADVEMATRICVNAKVQRPGVCNAAEGIVVDRALAASAVPVLVNALRAHGVRVRGCSATQALSDDVEAATDADFDTEFLDLVVAMKVVDGEAEALAFIQAHGSGHTECIVTEDHSAAMRFLHIVDASCVLVNASTRFNDGGELGLGAELGVSTSKLHAYGPMGLDELCTKKFVVFGHGETRGDVPPQR